MYSTLWGALDGAHARRPFNRQLDIRVPEDLFASDDQVRERYRKPVDARGIEESIATLLEAWQEGDRPRATEAADEMERQTRSHFAAQGVPIFAHPILPPQFVRYAADAVSDLPSGHQAAALEELIHLFKPAFRAGIAQELKLSPLSTHTTLKRHSSLSTKLGLAADGALLSRRGDELLEQVGAFPHANEELHQGDRDHLPANYVPRGDQDRWPLVGDGTPPPPTVSAPPWDRSPKRPREGQWRKIAEVRVPGRGPSDWTPVVSMIPGGEIRFVVRPADDGPGLRGETLEGPRSDNWVGKTPPPRYRWQRQPGPRGVGVPGPSGQVGWVAYRIAPDGPLSDIDYQTGSVSYGRGPVTTDLILKRRRGAGRWGATVLVKPAGEFGTGRDLIVEIWVRWA